MSKDGILFQAEHQLKIHQFLNSKYSQFCQKQKLNTIKTLELTLYLN